jgi:hypothetical protein
MRLRVRFRIRSEFSTGQARLDERSCKSRFHKRSRKIGAFRKKSRFFFAEREREISKKKCENFQRYQTAIILFQHFFWEIIVYEEADNIIVVIIALIVFGTVHLKINCMDQMTKLSLVFDILLPPCNFNSQPKPWALICRTVTSDPRFQTHIGRNSTC